MALKIDSITGRFVYSELKNITKEKAGAAPFEIFGKTKSPDTLKKIYILQTVDFMLEKGYFNPDFSEKLKKITDSGEIEYQLLGATERFDFVRKVRLPSTGYKISVEDSVLSKSNERLQLTPYVVIERDGSPVEEGGLMYTYLGPVFSSTNDTYEKYDFEDIKEAPYQNKSLEDGLRLSNIISYLHGCQINPWNIFIKQGIAKIWKDSHLVIPLERCSQLWGLCFYRKCFVCGAQASGTTRRNRENLDLTVDYGFLLWLGKPMYWFLELGNKIFNNWGMAIIFLTVVLKIITWPLSAKAYVSMGKMRELAPKMQQLQEKHGDNRQAMSQEMMQMYQKEGVNPLGGCFANVSSTAILFSLLLGLIRNC